MHNQQLLIYGANGYTGQLITRLSSEYQLCPVLAGRNEEAIRQLAEELGLPYRVIDLNDTEKLQNLVAEVKLVIHAAGPFIITASKMIEACIAAHTHYIDITGEIPVFELAKKYNERAIDAGVMIMPGVGFDVVPTDCMALYLKNKLPNANQLKLAFASEGGGLSHGTATTMVMGLGEGGAIRKDHQIIARPLGHKGMWIDLSAEKDTRLPKFVMTIPWGDVSTAHFTTNIPDIETYTAVSPKIFTLLKFQWLFNWLLRTTFFRKLAMKKINQMPRGPSARVRKKANTVVWGEVEGPDGKKVQATIQVSNGYTFTAHSSLIIAEKILKGNFKIGYQTPASAYGEDLVLEVPGTKRALTG